MRIRQAVAISTIGLLAMTGLAGCGGGSSADANTVTIAYWDSGSNSAKALGEIIEKAKTEFEKSHQGVTIKVSPIKAGEGDYATKLALMNRSADTAPDIMYEDTYRIGADAAAGYLAPMDEYLAKWPDWKKYPEAIHKGVTGLDGKIYGIPIDTDTRGLWYNKEVLTKAGITVPWQPKNWDDVLAAARKIKETQPDVLPMNIYAGKVKAEASSMQGFEMLLYGTPGGTLYDSKTNKWVVGSKNFVDALNFEYTLFKEKLGPSPQQLGNTAWDQVVNTQLFPENKVGISLDGSWVPGSWAESSNRPWKEWSEKIGWTAMPTQNGQEPGVSSMSGGWALSMGAHAKNKELTFEFMSTVMNFDNSLFYSIKNASVPVRDDVAQDPKFTESSPSLPFFSGLVKNTSFRPADPNYEKVSAQIQQATEAMLNQSSTPEEAAKAYDEAVKGLVGDDKTETK